MKNIITPRLALPLALIGAVLPLAIVGCGGGNGFSPFKTQPNPTTAPTTNPTTAPTTDPTTDPTTNPTTDPTTTPTTDPTTNPTTNPTTASTPMTVMGQRFVGQITSASGFNGDASAIDFTELASSNFDFSGTSGVTPTFDNNAPATPCQVQFTLFTPGSATVTPGPYAVKARPASTAREASAFYNEGAAKGWEGTSGTIIVDGVQGDIFTFRFVGVTMTFGRRFGSTDSQGSFTLSGSAQARVVCRTRAECS